MDTRSLNQVSVSTTPVKPDVTVVVKEGNLSDSDENSAQQTKALTVASKPQTITRSSSIQIIRVVDTTRTIKGRIIRELDDVDEHYFKSVNLESYLEFIADQRLIDMPRKGSQWDRVLKAAEFFGLQIYSFGSAISHFVEESKLASFAALASCRLLLELGHKQAQALEPTFNVLYEFGLIVAQTLQQHELLDTNETIKEDLGDVYDGLIGFAGEIALYYRLRINSMTTSSVVIDFNAAFGKTIEKIWAKKEHLSNHMWSFKLRHKHYSISIESLRRKLSPIDPSVKALLYGRLAEKAERAEGTCEWVQSHLLDFLRSNDSTFTITGAVGCGKSTLAGWMKERLQRPLGRHSYETLSYTFASDAPDEAKPMSFLKNLLFQLLERNVGDARLYEKLVKAFETYSEHKDAKELELALWEALEVGLETVKSQEINLVIVVDGFDEITGSENAANLHKRLHDCVDKFSRTRAITLSKPVSHLGGAKCKHLLITPEHTQHDIAAYLHQNLVQYQHYNSQSHGTREKFVEDLVKKAKGSFLWAYLVIKSLRSENSYESFFKAGQTMHSDIHGLLHKLIEKVDLKNPTTKHMLEFMLAAKRPLRVGEMEDLLGVNLQKRTITPITDIGKHIASSHCSVFVVERKGLIRFKHSAIRKFFSDELCGKTLPSIKEAHTELTKRMLFYARYYTLTVSYEPSFDVLGGAVLEETFRSHFLMEYIVRNWVSHFRSSAHCGAKGELALSSEFKEIFPDSTFFAMIEWSCWQSQTSITEAMEFHDLALRIRKACFGEKHHSVMQTMIIMGTFYRSMSDLVKASEFFYHASCIGQAILYKFSTVVVACTSLFLTCTETITITERTEIVTYRETMIRFMIEICKCKHGASSDHVIKWYEVLAKLYIDIKEEYRATIIYKELYEIIVIRFGKGHPRAQGISETLGGLNVVLKGGSEEEVVKYNEWIFETSEDMEVTHELRISIIIRLAHTYEAQGKWFLAEKLYINLWRRISEICRVKASIEMHMAKINIALEYVRFLQRIKRIEEASNILICLWAEYEHYSCESETLIIRIKEIGTLFKAFGLLTVAISVFTKIWGWFKSKGKIDHEEAVSITVLITEVVEEIIETTTTTTTKTTTTVTETVTETIVTEIFETSYTRCKNGHVDAHFFKACIALISLYIKQKKWSACEVVIRRSLELTWKAILTVDAEITLSGSFTKENILVATQLAICYHRQKYFEKAEEIYLRIYRACLISFSIEDIRVTEASLALIHFYEEYHRHDKTIEIYIELLHGYRKHCGAAHALTIKTLYALGSICIMLGRKDAYEYYIEIVTTLNKGGHCHHDAFEAAVIICRYYYEEKRWAELQKICAVLWETFIHRHHEFKFTEEMVTTLYERYIYVLEFHAKVEFSVLYKLSVQYRETVTKCFGVSAAIIITAMIALANICEKNEKHYHESVTIYEEVIKIITTTTTTTTTTTITESITKTVKKRLSKMYITIITKGHSTTRTTIERGIAICLEIYESLKLEFGCWHETTLTQLKELVILYKKHGSHDSTIIRLLQTSVIEIITKVTNSIILYHAASTLASIYVSVGLVKYGQDLLHQLRHLIILHDIASSTEITISLGSKVSKVAFVFLVAFEQGLAEKLVLSYSEIMADILLEMQLYEQYTQVIKTETKIEIVLEVGAKLHAFWAFRGRKVECDVLDRKLFAMFKAGYGACILTHDDITLIFYSALLVELGKERSTVDFGAIACLVSNLKVKALLEAGDFNKAHEVAKCAFQLISSQRFYHNMHNVSYGYKLAEYMAGIEVRKPADNKVRESMLETSRKIAVDVLAACREAKVNFVALKFEDVAGLVRLLGDQQNYGELESLLEELWQSREVQNTWSSTTVLSIGRSLVHAHYAAGHLSKAIELCDTICYNLRRSRGWLDADAIAMSKLLAELYTATNRHREAMGVHEEILREIDEDGDDEKAGLYVNGQWELLKRAYQRLGGWDKSEKTYRELFTRLKRFGLSVQPIEQWSPKGADSMGMYVIPKEWKLDVGKEGVKKRDLTKVAVRRSCGHAYLAGTAERESHSTNITEDQKVS